jgi:hypothetical protein
MASKNLVRFQKERKKRSWVWLHFEESKELDDSGRKEVTCTYNGCKEKIRFKDFNTTPEMSSHLEIKHKLLPPSKTNKDDEENDNTEIKEEKYKKELFNKEHQTIIDSNLYIL